ncbi:DUF3168 domain-containing protein [Chelativorans sp. AA-79]|uniref:tail completion protein gp17 n=1 Tax=Chelativorans sp. AA-79 TaxID=3028735 RepID=UPI0023F7C897|nr:DUF3168 domain-containing protein [Chelativorans sp. AA-79]WEX07372.1 DUF3168 domain-containing protein [Chelativorans sp. AA-79]
MTALLASVAGGKRYWGRAPQEVDPADGPYIVMQRIDALPDYTMGGATGYVQSRVQLDVYAITYTALRDTVRAIEAAISGYRGMAAGTHIYGIFFDSQRDLPAADAGEVNNLLRRSVDIIIHHAQ